MTFPVSVVTWDLTLFIKRKPLWSKALWVDTAGYVRALGKILPGFQGQHPTEEGPEDLLGAGMSHSLKLRDHRWVPGISL